MSVKFTKNTIKNIHNLLHKEQVAKGARAHAISSAKYIKSRLNEQKKAFAKETEYSKKVLESMSKKKANVFNRFRKSKKNLAHAKKERKNAENEYYANIYDNIKNLQGGFRRK
jgi:hypothetical protein